jgi:hypothetical protein
MTWKLLMAVILVPYAFLVMVTAAVNLSNNFSTDSPDYVAFMNSAASPREVTIDTYTVGSSQAPVSTQKSYPDTPIGWLIFLGKAISLQSSIWEGWAQPIRFIMLVFAAPVMLFFTLQLAQAISFFIGNLFGRAAP